MSYINVVILPNTRVYSLEPKLQKSEPKLESTPIMHAMALKKNYILLKYEYHDNIALQTSINLKRQTCIHILFTSPFWRATKNDLPQDQLKHKLVLGRR